MENSIHSERRCFFCVVFHTTRNINWSFVNNVLSKLYSTSSDTSKSKSNIQFPFKTHSTMACCGDGGKPQSSLTTAAGGERHLPYKVSINFSRSNIHDVAVSNFFLLSSLNRSIFSNTLLLETQVIHNCSAIFSKTIVESFMHQNKPFLSFCSFLDNLLFCAGSSRSNP